MTNRVLTAVGMGLREFGRTPVLLVLLVVLPAYFVGVFVLLVPETTIPIPVDGVTVAVSMSAFAAAFMTPVAVSILSGIVGLFLVSTSTVADDRLRHAGYSGLELVVSRVGILAVGIAVVSLVSVVVAMQVFEPANVGAFVVTTGLLGVTYGVIGIIVGLLFDRLAGVYAMLFVPMVDVLLFQNPLATDLPEWVTLLPGHYGTVALFEAAFTSGVDLGSILGATGYAAVLLSVSVLVFYRSTSVRY